MGTEVYQIFTLDMRRVESMKMENPRASMEILTPDKHSILRKRLEEKGYKILTSPNMEGGVPTTLIVIRIGFVA